MTSEKQNQSRRWKLSFGEETSRKLILPQNKEDGFDVISSHNHSYLLPFFLLINMAMDSILIIDSLPFSLCTVCKTLKLTLIQRKCGEATAIPELMFH